MRTILHVFIPTVMMLISLSCQNKIAFKIKSEELPDEPMHLHLVKDLGLWPTVTIKINGINIKLHVDTGGEGDAISLTKEQIEKINLLKIDKTRSTMNAHGEKRILHYYIAEKVELDGNTFTNCEIMEMPSANDKFDNIGLMGLGFLKYFTICFNFKNDKMELYPNISSALINEKNWKLIKLDKNNRCRGYLAGYNNEFTIGFDTGAIYVNGEKGYNWVRVKKNDLVDRFGSRAEYDFNVFTTDLITSENVKIDSLLFLIYETSQPDDVDIFLGYDFFSKYEVMIDYSGSKLYFK